MSTTLALPIIDRPGCLRGLGCLEVGPQKIKLPLSGVNIEGRVADTVAQVSIKQTFSNPHSEHLEAVYIFPLPGGATVSSFELRVGDRVIKGKVEERAQARESYQRALDEGRRAALLEQERDDVFTVQVGNLPPGEEVTVHLTYAEKLAYFDDGTTELRLPLVVSPRYVPGTPLDRDQVGDGVEQDTDAVPDASRITPPRLAPGVDPKVALSVSVEIQGGIGTLEDLSCSQHATRIGTASDGLKVSLSKDDELLDRDFVLRWRIASDKLQSNFVYFRDPGSKECFGMVSIRPPKSADLAPVSRDVVFVLDRSDSMNGVKMASAARSCSYLLSTLAPRDRYAILSFDNMSEWMNPDGRSKSTGHFTAADEAGVESGQKFLRGIQARGGTELDSALAEALNAMQARSKKAGRMPVIVIVTDGEIGDESRILKRIQKELGDNRVFTIGVDTAVNEGFLKRLALIGGGTSTFVEPGVQLEAALGHVSREIGSPLVLDLAILPVEKNGIGLDAASIAPAKLSDLFEGRSVTGFFRFKPGKSASQSVKITGRYAAGQDFVVDLEGKELDLSAIPQIWAKTHIVDLEDRFRMEPSAQDAIRKEIVELSVHHSILTKFTAFVVVDEVEVVNADGTRRKVVQPVEMPHRWDMAADGSLGLAGSAGANLRFRTGGAPMSPPSMAQPASWGAPGARGIVPPSAPAGSAGAGKYLMASTDAFGASEPTGQAYFDSATTIGKMLGAPAAGQGSDSSGSGPTLAESIRRKASSNTPPQQPAPACRPPQPPSQTGSYGSGVRAQVFETIVRQAIAGAPWEEICAGPMQVNNISPAEVEAEIQRRRAIANAHPSPPAQAPGLLQKIAGQGVEAINKAIRGVSGSGLSAASLKKALAVFAQSLEAALKEIDDGTLPSHADLEAERLKLLEALSGFDEASSVPKLQKFLRAEMPKLIAALQGANAVHGNLKQLSADLVKKFKGAQDEALELFAEVGRPFWESGV